MRKLLSLGTILFAASVVAAGGDNDAPSLDIGYYASASLGPAVAFGDEVVASADDFGSTVGSAASPAPVTGAAFSLGADLRISGPWRLGLGLEARRLGVSFWAPASGDYQYLSVWVAGLRLGARYEPGPWFAGLGGLASAPVSGIAQGGGKAGAGASVSLGVEAGRSFMPGAYLEGGLALAPARALGPFAVRPVLSLEAALWPGGAFDSMQASLADGLTAWQAALGLALTLDIAPRFP